MLFYETMLGRLTDLDLYFLESLSLSIQSCVNTFVETQYKYEKLQLNLLEHFKSQPSYISFHRRGSQTPVLGKL